MNKAIICLIIFAGFFAVATYGDSSASNSAQPNVIILSSSSSNAWLNYSVDYTVQLGNSGDANASNIKLRFICKAAKGNNSFIDTCYFFWGSTLAPQQTEEKTFNRKLPKGYKAVDPKYIAIVSQ